MLGQGFLLDLEAFLLTKDKSLISLALILINSFIINSLMSMNKNYANYLLNKITEDYNKIGDKYSSVRKEDWKEMSFLFDRYLKGQDKVLDLGCGNGRFYPAFKEREVDYSGHDSSSKLIEIAKKNYPEAKFEVSSVFDIKGSFNKIFSVAVLHHMPSSELRERFIEQCYLLLKEEGILVLTVWNLKEKIKTDIFGFLKKMGLEKGDTFLPWYGAEDVFFHCFTLEELVQLVSSKGFEIIDKGEILVGKKPYSNFYIVAKKHG